MLAAWDAVSTLDHLLDDVMGGRRGAATNTRTFQPAFDVHTSEAAISIVCDVPGLKSEDLEVTLENHVLTLEGTRRFDSREDEQVVLGRPYGAFRRSFTLPDGMDEVNLTATVTDGVLTVRIPKLAQARPRKIAVAAGPVAKALEV